MSPLPTPSPLFFLFITAGSPSQTTIHLHQATTPPPTFYPHHHTQPPITARLHHTAHHRLNSLVPPPISNQRHSNHHIPANTAEPPSTALFHRSHQLPLWGLARWGLLEPTLAPTRRSRGQCLAFESFALKSSLSLYHQLRDYLPTSKAPATSLRCNRMKLVFYSRAGFKPLAGNQRFWRSDKGVATDDGPEIGSTWDR